MSHFMIKYYNKPENPKKVMFFLHGYNGESADLNEALKPFADEKDLLIITPEAVEPCEKNPQKKQWYSLRAIDPTDQRRVPETSLPTLMDIYDRYADVLTLVAADVNDLIDRILQETGVDNAHTIIGGFSQGAMLACFTALTRASFDGRCLMFAGVTAGAPALERLQKSTPKMFLFHGRDDVTVNYKTAAYSQKWLEDHGCAVVVHSYDGLKHRISTEETADACACF